MNWGKKKKNPELYLRRVNTAFTLPCFNTEVSHHTDLGHSVEYAGCFSHPVVNLSLSSAGVYVSKERGHHREICGEAVVNILLLHRQVLSGYNTIGGHLERERVAN